ncbi:MAG: phosphate acetyltransferase [Desulfovibrionaceae bacterium]|nr:phosphate acetyltransferase [Desulfovibrionaceae bacterium]
MGKSVYVAAAESQSGKSVVMLGIMQLLMKNLRQVAIFRPIIGPQTQGEDHDINLLRRHFNLDIPYEDCYAYTLEEAQELINAGQRTLVLETIFNKFKQLEKRYDFVLCEGADLLSRDSAIEFELNMEIAAQLSCPMALVVRGVDKQADEILESTRSLLHLIHEKGLDVPLCLINRTDITPEEQDRILASLRSRTYPHPPLFCILPEETRLGAPTMEDIRRSLDGLVVYGSKHLDNLVEVFLVAAMQVGNFLHRLKPDCLVITPGDREDIVLACLSSLQSSAFPKISGIVLSGDIPLHESMKLLLEHWTGACVPIVAAKGHTFQIANAITKTRNKIDPSDQRKIHSAIGHFEQHVNSAELARRFVDLKSTRITPRMFEYNLLEKARQQKMRIVLPEGQDERILQAADALLRRGVADLIILGDHEMISLEERRLGLDLGPAQVVNPAYFSQLEDYVRSYHEMRKHKGLTYEQARDIILDPTYFGTMMVQKGQADGMVSGAANTTAHTVRPAFEIIRTKTAGATVSSVFFMCLQDRVLAFGDCAVIPNPTPQELAHIAVDAARTAAMFGIEPRVAMLSYSTGSSGKGEDVDKVITATALAKQLAPDLLLEGPLQYDAAIDPKVASTKMPDSQVAGRATIFIFPDLNTGNNTYKAVQRAANAVAIGPVLQGLKKPVNDLSRGANVADIINTVAITAIQAQPEKTS